MAPSAARAVALARLHEAGLVGKDDGLYAVADAELRENVGEVRLDRRLADVLDGDPLKFAARLGDSQRIQQAEHEGIPEARRARLSTVSTSG